MSDRTFADLDSSSDEEQSLRCKSHIFRFCLADLQLKNQVSLFLCSGFVAYVN